MDIRHVRQAVSEDSLFRILSGWCRDGAGHRDRYIRFLSAFATGGAIRAISPLIDVFLADGNRVDVIFGVDRNGTDRDAVVRLSALHEAYPQQVSVSVFEAPSRIAIFHPKLYLYSQGDALRAAVIGSANLTVGGLASNFESLLLYEALRANDREARELEAIWATFAHPAPPLLPRFCSPLTQAIVDRLLVQLPERSQITAAERGADIVELWRPLSTVPLPRSTAPPRNNNSRPRRRSRAAKFLLMDVLQETRHTQMQIPLQVVEDFFGVPRREAANIAVSIVTATGLSQPIERTLVISQGASGQRLMRRLEMPTIEGLDRPLIVAFVRFGAGRFGYRLFPRDIRGFRIVDRLLNQHGQQGRAQRRFYIGRIGDAVWQPLGIQHNL